MFLTTCLYRLCKTMAHIILGARERDGKSAVYRDGRATGGDEIAGRRIPELPLRLSIERGHPGKGVWGGMGGGQLDVHIFKEKWL